MLSREVKPVAIAAVAAAAAITIMALAAPVFATLEASPSDQPIRGTQCVAYDPAA